MSETTKQQQKRPKKVKEAKKSKKAKKGKKDKERQRKAKALPTLLLLQVDNFIFCAIDTHYTTDKQSSDMACFSVGVNKGLGSAVGSASVS